ncbi:MAG TPA: GDP-mannose 4,6-dehydratase [Brevefilum sp.]|nr:GDP-mannose 4,6-dehydratase [Brevefilum sp.]HPL69309.1 GDP-mannose 4,6-dehydratase [Brevefilum sp.]
MANYLISGVAGFIAYRVAELLTDSGHQVYGVDNLNDAYDVRLKEYRLKKLMVRSNFHFLKGDIAKRTIIESLKPWLPEKVDGVINLAARAGVRSSLTDPWVYVDTNLTGTLNLLELCRQRPVGKFILASTSSLYAEKSDPPFKETDDTDHPLQPYAASKKGAEAMAFAYHHLYGIDVTVLRYFTVYGPAGRPDMVMFRFCQWIAEGRPVIVNGDGEQSRGFTYLDDIARGTIEALKPLGYAVINLGGHEVITINHLIHMLEYRIGKRARIQYEAFHHADVHTNQADIRTAKVLLGWEPQVNLEEGVTHLVDWYMAERDWVSQVETP